MKYLKLIKKGLVCLFNPLFIRLGYVRGKDAQSDEYNKVSLVGNFFTILIQVGFKPKHIVDVGAHRGSWTREALKYFPDAYFTLLEPQDRMRDAIKDILETNGKVKFNAVGAGKERGSFKFTIVERDDSCSFRYSEVEAKAKGLEQIEAPVVSLNEFLPLTGLAVPDIIKIDAEGLDIEVLQGASDYFGKTEVFMVEAGIVNKAFSNSFLRVINFMDENNYRLFEITDLNRPFKPSVLWLVELVFIKKGGIIDSKSFKLS